MKALMTLLLSLGLSVAYAADPAMDTDPKAGETAKAADPAVPAEPATPKEKPATPAEPANPVASTEPATPMPPANVARSQFTSGIEGREPVDDLNNLDNTAETAFFFSEIRDGKGQIVTHEWWHEGELMAEVDFNVNGNRWRIWSSKDFMPEWTGKWTVRVVDQDDRKLAEQSFRYTPAPIPTGDAMGDGMTPAAQDAAQDAEPVAESMKETDDRKTTDDESGSGI